MYPDLYAQFGWTPGVHRAPVGYQHPWLVVTQRGTIGAYSRDRARAIWREVKATDPSVSLLAIADSLV